MRSGARIKDKELMRERILRAAIEVFAEEGFDAPVDHICERAGVSKGLFLDILILRSVNPGGC